MPKLADLTDAIENCTIMLQTTGFVTMRAGNILLLYVRRLSRYEHFLCVDISTREKLKTLMYYLHYINCHIFSSK